VGQHILETEACSGGEYSGEYGIVAGRGIVVDSSAQGNLTRFINHSCCSNITYRYLHRGEVLPTCPAVGNNEPTPKVVFEAHRAIKEGEELTFDYNTVTCGKGGHTPATTGSSRAHAQRDCSTHVPLQCAWRAVCLWAVGVCLCSARVLILGRILTVPLRLPVWCVRCVPTRLVSCLHWTRATTQQDNQSLTPFRLFRCRCGSSGQNTDQTVRWCRKRLTSAPGRVAAQWRCYYPEDEWAHGEEE
jgi:hypothetical protein